MTRSISFAALISHSPSHHSFSIVFFFVGFKIEVLIAKILQLNWRPGTEQTRRNGGEDESREFEDLV